MLAWWKTYYNPYERKEYYAASNQECSRYRRYCQSHAKVTRLAAGASGVGESFLGKVESGNPSVNWGMLFQVLSDLGIELSADITEAAVERLQRDAN